jgi:hypothetical protein
MGFSIFSYTPNKQSDNSAVLHRHEAGDEGLAREVTRGLRKQGHKIVNVMRNESDANQDGSHRRDRRR